MWRCWPRPGDSGLYTQDSPGFPSEREGAERFGAALAAGRTSTGQPFLLIGSPGDGLESGTVYYVRGSTVSVIHQDVPGAPDQREISDGFGETVAASERFIAVASQGGTIGGHFRGGMVHVFSHTLTGGRPTPIGAFHQDTPGIAEFVQPGEFFGLSLSVLSYRPTPNHPVGALVAVGTPFEDVDGEDSAGIVHVVYVSPRGAVRQQVAVTQDTAGVSDLAVASERFGADVTLAHLHPASNVATPQSLVWAVAVAQERAGTGLGAVHVFRPGWQPGDPDIFVHEGARGIEVMGTPERLRATHTRLLVGNVGPSCTSLSWSDLLTDGPLQPEDRPFDDCV